MSAPVLQPIRQLTSELPWHHGSAVESLAIDATGSRFLAAGRFLAQVRLVESGEVVCSLEGVGKTLVPRGPIVFDATGRFALGFCVPEPAWNAIPLSRRREDAPLEGVIATWNAETGMRTREIPCHAARLLAFSGDRRGAIVTDAGAVARWNLETALPAGRIENVDPAETRFRLRADSAAFLSGTRAVLSRSRIREEGPPRPSFRELVDFDSGAVLRRDETRNPDRFASADGKTVIAASYGEVTVRTGPELDSVATKVPGAMGVTVSPDGARFACSIGDGPIRVHDTKSGAVIATAAKEGPAALANDGRIVVARGDTGRLSVHDSTGADIAGVEETLAFSGVRVLFENGRALLVARHEIRLDPTNGTPLPDAAPPICFDGESLDRVERTLPPIVEGKTSPDGRWRLQAIVADGGWRVHRTDLRTGVVTREPGDTLRVVNHVAFAPDGDRVASGTFLTDVVMWRISTFEILGHLKTSASGGNLICGLTWSPDDRWIAAGNDYGSLVAWEIASRREIVVRARDERSISVAAAGPRGLLAFAARDERHTTLWNLDTGAAIARLEGHAAPVSGIAFLPDGQRVVTTGLDGRVLAYSLP